MKNAYKVLRCLLLWYEEASGQAINTAKSSFSFSRPTTPRLKVLVKYSLQLQNERGVEKYLGLFEHFGNRKKYIFASIVDMIKQKAKGWSNRLLSTAMKLVMLKSVLNAIPFHVMTCFKLLVSLYKQIQSWITRFWWDSNSGTKKKWHGFLGTCHKPSQMEDSGLEIFCVSTTPSLLN